MPNNEARHNRTFADAKPTGSWLTHRSAAASTLVVVLRRRLQLDRGRKVEVDVAVLGQRVAGNRLERLLDIDVLLGRGLKVGNVTLGGAPGQGALLAHAPLVLQINLVAQHHKRERVRVARAGLKKIFSGGQFRLGM